MLLRSSSTPVFGSLLHSFAESPNNNNNLHHETSHSTIRHHFPPPTTALHQTHNKVSLHQSAGSFHLSCNSSPISPSFPEISHSSNGIRRAQSAGNLEGLLHAPCSSSNEENSSRNNPPTKCLKLETIRSFAVNNSRFGYEEKEDKEGVNVGFDEETENAGKVARAQGDKMMGINGGELDLANKDKLVLREEIEMVNKSLNLGFEQEMGLVSQGLFLARGLGIDGNGGGGGGHGGGGGGEFFSAGSGGDGGNNQSIEEYYRRMVKENPANPLFLRNYAQFLYQSKQDLEGAMEYYSRAILLDPNDGEILSQYAKLVWKLHRDLDRASFYFERAIQASPQDSHVHAAYASFLWETEEDEDECNVENAHDRVLAQVHQGPVASANA